MSPGTSGLKRDLDLIRRRAWLFLPFLVLGIVLALGLRAVSGQATADAVFEIDTVINDVSLNDRGLRIYEAQSMTNDERFADLVITEIGDPDFDYNRFDVTLRPIAVSPGTSRGDLRVSIRDDDSAQADAYMDAFELVFAREFTSQDGLFRARYMESTQRVVDNANASFQAGYARLAEATAGTGLPIDALIRSRPQTGLLDALAEQEGELRAQLARTTGALTAAEAAGGATADALASSTLGQPVAAGQGLALLQAHAAGLEQAVEAVATQARELSDASLEPEVAALVSQVRALHEVKDGAGIRHANAQAAAASSDTTYSVERTASGGLASSIIGQVAVVLVVTLVFGLIAIYSLEWLSQVRRDDGV